MSFKLLKTNQILLSALLLSAVGSVCAQKQNSGNSQHVSAINLVQTTSTVDQPANSFVELDFSLAQGESWDGKDQANNMLVNCINGSIITGFETSDVVIKTEGRSFFSEAVIYFSDSNQGDNGIEFAAGANNNSSGTSSFSTSNILDITDLGIFNVEALSDDKFYLQFYEITDDVPNGIDARYISGKIKVWGVDLVAAPSCPFVASADISVSYSANNDNSLSVGDNLVFDVTVTNNSANTALNVVLENTLSESLLFVDLSCDNGFSTTDASAIQSVAIGDVLANSGFSCSLSTEVLSLGDITNIVKVTSDNDSDLNNNSVTLAVMASTQSIPVSNLFMLVVLFLLLLASSFYSIRTKR